MNSNDFWDTPRGKALLKMIIWAIFFIILFTMSVMNRNNNSSTSNNLVDQNEKQEEQPTNETFKIYEDMQKELLNSNYEYSYEITSNDNKYIINGYKCNGKYLEYVEDNEGISKYYQNGDKKYKVNLNTLVEVDNSYDMFDGSFLDIENLFGNLKSFLYKVEKKSDTREINYNKDGYQVKVETDTANITRIIISTENSEYNLNFVNMGYCGKIDFDEQ